MVGLMEKIKLYYKMIFLNRRSTIAMFLGLGISLALIAESLMFMYSFQFGAFEGFYNGTPAQQFTVSISSFDIRGEIEGSIPRLQEISERAIENAELSDRKAKWRRERHLTTTRNAADCRGRSAIGAKADKVRQLPAQPG